MIDLGLCCNFIKQPIKFKKTTLKSIRSMDRDVALHKLSGICLDNAEALLKSLRYCYNNKIGCFRINSSILPVKTHPEYGYEISDLPHGDLIIRLFKECGSFAAANEIRTCFHPSQFVVLNSNRPEVVESSIAEIEYQAELAEWVNADVINIHGGGAYGCKKTALQAFFTNFQRLSDQAKNLLTVENDDLLFTPSDLLPMCRSLGVPLLYDVHHHRCNRDDLTVEEATELSIETWNRKPMFHISSPKLGWDNTRSKHCHRYHHDYVDVNDFPRCWLDLDITVEVEAKRKELAVIRLMSGLQNGSNQVGKSSQRSKHDGLGKGTS